MMSSPTQSQRATTWLCLVLALCIAVLPATGLMLCLGHDGHVSLAAGSSQAHGCPCDHREDEPQVLTGTELTVTTLEVAPVHGPGDALAQSDQEHPCEDLDLDAPEAVRSAGLSQDLPTLLGRGIADWTTRLHLQTLVPSALESHLIGSIVHSWDSSLGKRARPDRSGSAVPLPLEQLAHRRSVVLLI
jgi:hypothetical protein